MSILSFLSQKTYPGECLRPEVILSRSHLKNVVFGYPPLPPPLSTICCCHIIWTANIFRIFISIWNPEKVRYWGQYFCCFWYPFFHDIIELVPFHEKKREIFFGNYEMIFPLTHFQKLTHPWNEKMTIFFKGRRNR